jgi:hypothetical protein
MRITSKDLVGKTRGKVRDWICEEVLSSLTDETIYSPTQNDEDGHVYEIKLVINGIEVEPKLLQRLYDGIEKIVDDEAAIIADNKLKDALSSIDTLHEVIKEAEYKIRDKFNIEDKEY